jgi:three-Cys-motif partner protein
MAQRYPCLGYVDCFAGPGEYASGEPGSPIVALDIARQYLSRGILKPHQLAMVFIEANKRRHKHLVHRYNVLKSQNSEISQIAVDVRCAEFSESAIDVQAFLLKRRSGALPIFYFIDPFGVKGLPYSVLRHLLVPDGNEFLFTFMYEETNRFYSSPEFEEHLDSMFGEPYWRTLRTITGNRRKLETIEYFKRRLLSAGAKYVVAFEMRNSRNTTDYFLLFATKNIRGLEVMKEAMWDVDRSGNFMFSDYTYSKGPLLIELSPDYSPLQTQLLAHFANRRHVSVAEIREFVLTHTSFLRFMNEALRPMIARNQCYIEHGDRQSSRLDRDAILSFGPRAGTPLGLFGD